MTNYSILETEAAEWSAKTNLGQLIPSFIRLAEARINREVRTLDMVQRGTITVTDGAGPLPERFLGFRSVAVDLSQDVDGAQPSIGFQSPVINYLPPDRFAELTAYDGEYYTIEGGNIRTAPEGNTVLKVSFFQAYPALTAFAPTHPLIINNYDLYLYGVLAEIWNYLQDAVQETQYLARFSGIVQIIHRSERRKARAGPHQRAPGVAY